MERDLELIREILLRLDQNTADKDWLTTAGFPEASRDAVAYHVELLEEAGLAEAAIGLVEAAARPATGVYFRVERLTREGHDFLDAVRNDAVWDRTKETLRSKGLSFAFEIVKSVATSVARDLLK
jgi:hypothetical protein